MAPLGDCGAWTKCSGRCRPWAKSGREEGCFSLTAFLYSEISSFLPKIRDKSYAPCMYILYRRYYVLWAHFFHCTTPDPLSSEGRSTCGKSRTQLNFPLPECMLSGAWTFYDWRNFLWLHGRLLSFLNMACDPCLNGIYFSQTQANRYGSRST